MDSWEEEKWRHANCVNVAGFPFEYAELSLPYFQIAKLYERRFFSFQFAAKREFSRLLLRITLILIYSIKRYLITSDAKCQQFIFDAKTFPFFADAFAFDDGWRDGENVDFTYKCRRAFPFFARNLNYA